MNRIKHKRRINQVRCAAEYYIVYAISKLYRVHDNAWLIAERGTDARDNGYVFYKYLKKRTSGNQSKVCNIRYST